MIAGQGSISGLIRQCQLDVNAPLAYVMSWLWAPLSGLSNSALRLPSTLFVCATPLLVLAARRDMPRRLRFVWAALLACWVPGIMMAEQARCYASVIFLATGGTIAFVRVLRRPNLVEALIWTSLSSLLILDHYFAAILVGCQGLAYLFVHREKALRTWPAALAFAPALVALALKAQMLTKFATPGVSLVSTVRLADLPELLGFLAGAPVAALAVSIWIMAGVIGEFRSRGGIAARPPQDDSQVAVGIAAIVALASGVIAVGLGFLIPILNERYLTIIAPGVFLGLAALAHRFGRRQPMAPVVLVAGFFGLALWFAAIVLLIAPRQTDSTFSFQSASEALMADNARRLVFFWDNPANQGGAGDTLAQVGGFFFKRAGAPIPIEAVPWTKGADPSATLLSRARTPGTAILWIYDRNVVGTLALDHPPAIDRLAPNWSCRDFGGGSFGVLACHQRPAA